ncbi:MAG: IPT/TIG domain-containing protein [Terriglobia bacterium]
MEFFFNADASLMEGHSIDDNGNGSFTITGATTGFGKLDQYLGGLAQCGGGWSLVYVKPAAGSHHVPTDVTEPSDIGLTFSGTRADLTAYDIIAALGPRIPDAVSAPKVIHQATILLVLPGTSPTADELAKLTRMQQRFQSYFAQATEGLGTVDIQLSGAQPVISSVSPSSGSTLGNTQVYISGNDFQAGATVSFGGVSATNVQFVSSTLVIATTGPSPAGPVAVTLTNPGAQAVALPNAYTYQVYAPVTVPANALRIPYAVDTVYFRSNLGINNPNPTEATVQLLELDNNGLQVNSPASVKIPGNGYLQINSVLAYLEGAASSTGRECSLVLESDLPIQGFVSQIENETGDPSILDGIQTGVPRLILQSSANTGPFRSNLVVLNLSQNPAVVTLTALSRDTGQPIGTPLANLSIAGNGFITYANVLEALSVADSYGPVEIRSLNGAQLVAVSRVSGLNAGTSGFFAAQSEDSGSHSEIIPFVIDTDTFRTNLGINNLGSDVANFQITWFDKQGNGITLASARRSVQVAPLGMLQINNILRFLINGSSNSNITNQEGYLQITADQPIRAFATQIHNLTQDPSIEESVSSGSSHLLLKSSANLEFKSTVVIVNPNDVPVSATILARQGESTGNGNVTATQTITIPAKGYFSSDNVLQDLGATSNFGPIEIISPANTPLIAVSRVYDSTANTSGFFSAEPIP